MRTQCHCSESEHLSVAANMLAWAVCSGPSVRGHTVKPDSMSAVTGVNYQSAVPWQTDRWQTMRRRCSSLTLGMKIISGQSGDATASPAYVWDFCDKTRCERTHTHMKNWSLEFKKQAALRSPLKKRAHLKHHHPEIIWGAKTCIKSSQLTLNTLGLIK